MATRTNRITRIEELIDLAYKLDEFIQFLPENLNLHLTMTEHEFDMLPFSYPKLGKVTEAKYNTPNGITIFIKIVYDT